jgi:DNA-binding SARP family transcriptional activator
MENSCEKSNEILIFDALKSLSSSFHGINLPNFTIEDGLETTREAYDADLAFLLSMDVEIGVFGVIEIVQRDDSCDEMPLVTERRIGKNLFNGLILPEETNHIVAEELRETYPLEYQWMTQNGIDDLLLIGIITRTAFVGFIGVCNARRMIGETYMLALARGMLFTEIRALLLRGQMTKDETRSRILEDNDVIINMFGGFEIRTNMGRMRYLDFSSSQCCLMLIYLIIHRDRIVSVREIAEILWPDQLFDNPYNMVKGVAFRLRKLLSPICDKSLVVANHGTYAINEELMIVADTDHFERTCDMLEQKNLSPEERLSLFDSAISLYKGDLLPNFDTELWLIGRISYYQLRYWNVLKEYLMLLDRSNQDEKFFLVAAKAMNVTYADADIYYLITSVLIKQNRFEMARSAYMKMEKMLTPEQRKAFSKLWSEKMNNK